LAGSALLEERHMNVLEGSPRVDITISVNPEFELRLVSVSIQERISVASDLDGNRLEIGHAWFSIFSEVGEISTGVLLAAEYMGQGGTWRLVVVPRPALEPLAEAMGKLVMAEGGEAIRRQAEGGVDVCTRKPRA
jgi:hypothetical protein